MPKSTRKQYTIRLTEDVFVYLQEQAELSKRSMSNEILARLIRTMEQDEMSEDIIKEMPEGVDLSEQSELQLIELFKQIRRDQSALLDLLNSNDFAKQLFKRGFASVLK